MFIPRKLKQRARVTRRDFALRKAGRLTALEVYSVYVNGDGVLGTRNHDVWTQAKKNLGI